MIISFLHSRGPGFVDFRIILYQTKVVKSFLCRNCEIISLHNFSQCTFLLYCAKATNEKNPGSVLSHSSLAARAFPEFPVSKGSKLCYTGENGRREWACGEEKAEKEQKKTKSAPLLADRCTGFGTVGIIAFVYQFIKRNILIWKKATLFNMTIFLSYISLELMSLVNPGILCPMPYLLLITIFMIVVEKCDDGEAQEKIPIFKNFREKILAKKEMITK
jgi:hypothetical protein